METIALWTTSIVLVGTSAFLFGMLVRSIVHERRDSGLRRIWRNFGLSLTFAALFLVSRPVRRPGGVHPVGGTDD